MLRSVCGSSDSLINSWSSKGKSLKMSRKNQKFLVKRGDFHICIKLNVEDSFEFLLIRQRVVIPKGAIFILGPSEIREVEERDETIKDAAQCEMVEYDMQLSANWDHDYFENEAGNTAYEGHMFPLFVTELVPWPEKEIHERTWICNNAFTSSLYAGLISKDECLRSKKTSPKRVDERSHGTISKLPQITKQTDQRGNISRNRM